MHVGHMPGLHAQLAVVLSVFMLCRILHRKGDSIDHVHLGNAP